MIAGQSPLTFKDLARLIDLIPHFVHICFIEIAMGGVTGLNTSATRQEIVGPSQTVAVQTCQELGGRIAVEIR